MCWWGEAMANGPNINAAMDSEQNRAALAALEKARALSVDISVQERALIAAQARRYAPETEGDRSELDAAYADAMLALAQQFPENDDLTILAAEAAMNTSPWNYWDEDGAPRPRIGEAVALVERVMARNGAHPQASHLYIHLMESPRPNLAEAAADRLAQTGPPGLGHLVHMPAHIYHRLGRYADSVRVNIAAARADEMYVAAIGDDGAYRFGYYPHNVHFLLTSAQMLGDMGTVIHESERLTRILDVNTAKALPWVQAIHAAPYFAAVQYQTPAAILSLTRAPSELPYVEGIRHYARAIAYAHTGNKSAFERELGSLDALSKQPEIVGMANVGLPAQDLLQLAGLMAKGRAAHLTGDYQSAIGFYTSATEIESKLPYNEPAFWYQPVAQSLGASLFEAGRLQEARTSFRKALVQAPNNGWALYGLAATERKMGNALEAKAADAALERNWIGERRWLQMNRL
jgi:tetratricopeptide (TPR) repeat protein